MSYALSFQAGANLVAPHSAHGEVHAYLRDESDREFFERHLKLREIERGANVYLCRPHYRHSAFHHMQEVEGLQVASDLQLYLARGRGLQQLLLEAGLRPEPRDSSPRPAQIFSGEIEGDHLEIEFFTPMTGKGGDDAIEVQDNLLSLLLRFADIVISNAIEVTIDDHPLYTSANPINLLAPSPEHIHRGV